MKLFLSTIFFLIFFSVFIYMYSTCKSMSWIPLVISFIWTGGIYDSLTEDKN